MRLVFVSVLSLCFVALPSSGSQQQKPADGKQPSAQQSQSNPPITVSDNHYSATVQENRPDDKAHEWPPPWWSPFYSNWAFVLVGLCAALAAVWTLFAIKEQATHTRHAAKSGSLNAKAAMKQFLLLKRQLENSEAIQAARLVFEDFQAEIVPGPNFVADITITLTNYGGTVAHDLSMDEKQWGQFGSYNLEYNPNPTPSPGTAVPQPKLTGPSLGPGKSRVYRFRVGEPMFPLPDNMKVINIPGVGAVKTPDGTNPSDRVLSGKEAIFINPSASYTDIFGKPHIVTDCFTYRHRTKDWGFCPNLRQRQ